MNVFKRIAELAQSRFMNTENIRSGNHLNEEGLDNGIVTPQNVYRASTIYAPQRRLNAVTRYVARREQIVINTVSSNNSTEVEEVASTSTVFPVVPSSNLQLRSQSQRHSFQIQIARNLIDFARGYPNSRAHHRRVINNKLINSTRMISPANPQYYPNSFVDEMVRPYKYDIILNGPLPTREKMERHAWNPQDRSLNIYVKEQDKLTIHRHPVPQSTDCIRGKVGYSKGFHVWQLIWATRQRGTHPIVGVATKNAILHSVGYGSLLGSNTESYGWDIKANKCHHDSKCSKGWNYPASKSDDFVVPEKFYCILDMDEGYMAFASTEYLGIAFRGLKGKTLYPVVSAVWGHCEITMRYIGGLDPQPPLLIDICRKNIRLQMGKSRLSRISEFNLPSRLENFTLGKGI